MMGKSLPFASTLLWPHFEKQILVEGHRKLRFVT
jgi:hypothetical protein